MSETNNFELNRKLKILHVTNFNERHNEGILQYRKKN